MNSKDRTELENTYARLQTRAFSIVLEIILIFGLPALLAVWIGGMIGEGNTATYILLAAAFILSWIILFMRIRKINRELREMRERLEKEKRK